MIRFSQDSAISLKDSYFKVEFDVKHKTAGNALYGDGKQTLLLNLISIAPFSQYKLTGGSGNEIFCISCLLCKMDRTSKLTDDLSIGTHRSNTARKPQLTS